MWESVESDDVRKAMRDFREIVLFPEFSGLISENSKKTPSTGMSG